MSELSELITSFQAAVGPDRELDCRLFAAVDGREFAIEDHRGFGVQYVGRRIEAPHDSRWLNHRESGVASYTGSIDAALGLVSKVLPGWIVENMAQSATGKVGSLHPFGWSVELSDGDQEFQGQAATAPLAICLAALRVIHFHGVMGRPWP